jgi:hypothetical protein
MVASASRLIALLGLLGILATTLGIGYAILWRSFVYGTAPDLTVVRNFLLASAILFVPYVANQVCAIFDRSGGAPSEKSGPAAEKAPTGSISGIDPALPESGAVAQDVRFTGSGFQKGLTVTLIDPRGTKHTLSANSLVSVSPSLVGVTTTLDQPGEWKAAVTNPGEPGSDVFRFSVPGPPTVTGLNPAAPASTANAQKLVVIGEGFMDGLSVKLTNPGGLATTVLAGAALTSVSPTQVVFNGVLPNVGGWQVVISNPGNRDSAAFPFNVT